MIVAPHGAGRGFEDLVDEEEKIFAGHEGDGGEAESLDAIRADASAMRKENS